MKPLRPATVQNWSRSRDDRQQAWESQAGHKARRPDRLPERARRDQRGFQSSAPRYSTAKDAKGAKEATVIYVYLIWHSFGIDCAVQVAARLPAVRFCLIGIVGACGCAFFLANV